MEFILNEKMDAPLTWLQFDDIAPENEIIIIPVNEFCSYRIINEEAIWPFESNSEANVNISSLLAKRALNVSSINFGAGSVPLLFTNLTEGALEMISHSLFIENGDKTQKLSSLPHYLIMVANSSRQKDMQRMFHIYKNEGFLDGLHKSSLLHSCPIGSLDNSAIISEALNLLQCNH